MKKYLILLILAALTVSCAEKPRSALMTGRPRVSDAVRLVFQSSIEKQERLSPRGISYGPDGSLYICDQESRSVMRLKQGDESVSRFAGFESRAEGRFDPVDVSASGGVDVFVLDGASSRVFLLDRELRRATLVYEGAPGEQDRFGLFRGLAHDRETGDFFLTDRANGAVMRLDLVSGIARAIGGFGSERRSLRVPSGIDVDGNGTLFVADPGSGAVAMIPRSGGEPRFLGTGVLEAPEDVAVLPKGRIAVADRRGVLILDREGIPEGLAGYGTDREMQPRSVTFHAGLLSVADARSGSILTYRLEQP